MSLLSRIVIFVSAGAIAVFALFVFPAAGQEPPITFPIPELGNCASENECRAYCDDQTHAQVCIDFAVANGFMSSADAERAKAALAGGPGGCRGEDECRAYCEAEEHVDECLVFAESKGFISAEDAELARTLRAKSGPGGCRNEEECRAYCDDAAHRDECLDFAVGEGLLTTEEAAEIKRITIDVGPGGCQGEEACRDYCENTDHVEECLTFAAEHGLMPPELIEQARKGLEILKTGGPGGCKDHEECQTYCESPDNQEECFNFAANQGLIPPEEIERFKKGQEISKIVEEQGGPGGCTNDETCLLYCSQPDKTEECLNFAVEHGGFDPEEARQELERFRSGEFDEYRGRFEQERERFEKEFQSKREEFEKQFESRRAEFEERFRQQREGFEQRFQDRGGFPEGAPEEFPGGPPEGFPGFPSGEFPGGPPEGFPGFPSGEFPGEHEFPGQGEFPTFPSEFPTPQEFPGPTFEFTPPTTPSTQPTHEFTPPTEPTYVTPPTETIFSPTNVPPPEFTPPTEPTTAPTSAVILNLPAFILNFFAW